MGASRSGRALLAMLAAAMIPTACRGGASAYHLLGDVAEELDAGGAIVEVGSDRGEGSTRFLAALANRTQRSFFSVDFSEEGYLNARQACGSCAHRGMGERWLEDADGFAAAAAAAGMERELIAVAYLDNYDWTYPWTTAMSYKLQQHRDYQQQGLSLSNAKSQETHLRQAMAVEVRCTERCFVLFDDTWAGAAAGLYNGKGGRAVGYLMAKGFEVVQQSSGISRPCGARARMHTFWHTCMHACMHASPPSADPYPKPKPQSLNPQHQSLSCRTWHGSC